MRAMIVDDERLARAAMRRLLATHRDVEIVAEAANADQAAAWLRSTRLDVMFLDVEMPGRSGLELLADLAVTPPVIFTTAYSEYAVQAFELSAIDYLVKPIEAERLAVTLARIRRVLASSGDSAGSARQLFLREGQRCWVVGLDRIRLLESLRNSTRIYFDSERVLVYRSLAAFEAILDPGVFFRASRSHVINLRCIASLDVRAPGGLDAVLRTGERIEISRRRARRLRALLRP
jgi:two-component system LytT family response regulator